MHPERITQKDKELTNDLHYDEIKLPADKEDFSKIEKKKKKNVCNNVFGYEKKLTFKIFI